MLLFLLSELRSQILFLKTVQQLTIYLQIHYRTKDNLQNLNDTQLILLFFSKQRRNLLDCILSMQF